MTSRRFQDAFDKASSERDTGPLADYLEAAASLSVRDMRRMAVLLRTLRFRMPGERGLRVRERHREPEAQHQLARMVASRQKLWRRDHHRSRVPLDITERMIGDDIDAGMIWPAAWQNPERRGAVIEEVKRLLKNQAQRLLRRERPRAFPERLQGLARKRY